MKNETNEKTAKDKKDNLNKAPAVKSKSKAAETGKPGAKSKKKAKTIAQTFPEKAGADAGNGKKELKILFAAGEALPFVSTGGLGEVIGSLPRALREFDGRVDARVILPLYGSVKQSFGGELTDLGSIYVELAWRRVYCGVFSAERGGVTYYFIDNEQYFGGRPNPYSYYDDAERFAFFSKAVLSVLPLIAFMPHILHAHDWHSALIPVYLKTRFAENPAYRAVRSVFTIHNIEYQGKFTSDILGDVFGLSDEELSLVEYDGSVNLMKGAIDCADRVTTVSGSYAQEIKGAEESHGLFNIILRNEAKLSGILNGIDYESYNPETDPALFKNYGPDNLAEKEQNKTALQEMLGLPHGDAPMIGVISRLASHKGIDLICEIAGKLLSSNVQLVVLGQGDRNYEDYFEGLQRSFPAQVRAMIDFSHDMARKIYAAADLFLMPSKSEPCGLSQMIAARYGTVPVVREVGGLRDSIQDATLGAGNGFSFRDYTGRELKAALDRAIGLYWGNKEDWRNLQRAAMSTDFSWKRSAGEYVKLYEGLLDLK
jgi:starch synthase